MRLPWSRHKAPPAPPEPTPEPTSSRTSIHVGAGQRVEVTARRGSYSHQWIDIDAGDVSVTVWFEDPAEYERLRDALGLHERGVL